MEDRLFITVWYRVSSRPNESNEGLSWRTARTACRYEWKRGECMVEGRRRHASVRLNERGIETERRANWDEVVCSFPLILLETWSLHSDSIILFMSLYLDIVRYWRFLPAWLLEISSDILLSWKVVRYNRIFLNLIDILLILILLKVTIFSNCKNRKEKVWCGECIGFQWFRLRDY